LANLAKVHHFANAPASSSSPLSSNPTHEEVLSLLEAYRLTWKLSHDNDASRPHNLRRYRVQGVARTLSPMRTFVDLQFELYLKSDPACSS